jgi:hypothetical protein
MKRKKTPKKSNDLNNLLFFQIDVLECERKNYQHGNPFPVIDQLIMDAEEALKRGPYSVIDKKTLPPNGNANDYWHPAPYWWPNPKTKNGLPYIRRDGKRVPGTRMYEKDSDNYDRTRLQRVFDDSILLALGWYFTGEMKYAEHGVKILERFFVNPVTQMSPHLKYAQVRLGWNKNKGYSTGIIEMKDMYYYLDAVRLLNSSGAIAEVTLIAFKEWLATYLDWLVKSPQGKKELKSKNNHGTYYDLQVAAIAHFLCKDSIVFETLARAKSRIEEQFAPNGSQPKELKRNTTAHYCCFNLQGWINIATIVSKYGENLWSYEASNGVSLIKAAQWLLSYAGKTWPYQQIDEFDTDRFLPIRFSIPNDSIDLQTTDRFPKSKYIVKSKFFPHDGVHPYWHLGRKGDESIDGYQ